MKDLLTIDNITRVYKIQMSCTANLPDNLYYNITDTSLVMDEVTRDIQGEIP